MFLKYLIIGLGKLGKIHLSKILTLTDGVSYKIVDLKNLDYDFSEVPYGWNFDYDVVVVSTPTETHLETVMSLKQKFLKDQKNPLILIEKPVGQTAIQRKKILEILNTITHSTQTNSTEVFSGVTNEITRIVKSSKGINQIKFKRTSLGQSHAEPFSDLIWHDMSILAETKILNCMDIRSIHNINFTKKTKTAVHFSYYINKSKEISIEHEARFVKCSDEIDRKCTLVLEDGNSYVFDFVNSNVSLNSKLILEVEETDKIMQLWTTLSNHQNSGIDHSHLYTVSKIFETIEAHDK